MAIVLKQIKASFFLREKNVFILEQFMLAIFIFDNRLFLFLTISIESALKLYIRLRMGMIRSKEKGAM